MFLAVASAIVCSLALGTRTLSSVDLGYHLAYGEQALSTGHLVDHNAYLYTLPPENLAPSARPATGPGSWYDERGRYRFPNANWLSQLSMAAVHRFHGVGGLCVLTAVLVLGLALSTLLTSRRSGLSWSVSALSLLWLGLAGYSRFNLRPELFGYLVFAGQLILLSPLVLEPRRAAQIGAPRFVALAALQLAFVNLHSYWPLGLLVCGAIFCECWARSVGGSDAAWRRARLRSGLLLLSMCALCFANPWTWRLVTLPFETLLYLREHQIGGVPGEHPWSHIQEFRRTLHAGFPARVSDFGIVGLLLLGALGSLAALLRRRFALLLVLIAMSGVALSMRRNVAPAALVLIPLGCAALRAPLAGLASRWAPGLVGRSVARLVFATGVVVAACVFSISIVSHRFYESEGHPMRFGIGISRANLPIGAAGWLDAHLPNARVWCDMASSSTLHFFTNPHRALPILSNTWAFPPSVLGELQELRSLRRPVGRLVDDHAADVVVLNYARSLPLFDALAKHPIWRLVHAEGRHVMFARADGRQAQVARTQSLASVQDPAAYVARQRQVDPSLKSALLQPGIAYLRAGLGELAALTFAAVVRERPDWTPAWNYLGLSYRARGRGARDDVAANLDAARRAFGRALELDPGNELARRNLAKLSQPLSGTVEKGTIEQGTIEHE